MKLKKLLNLGLCLIISASLSACSQSDNNKDKNNNKIIVGATQVPGGDLLEHLKPLIEAEGYELDLKIFTDYNTPNTALDEGSIDANLFQHKPYLQNTIDSQGYDLTAAAELYESALLVYSYKIKSLDELKSGDKFLVPDDPTNGSRALLYLEEENLIKLNKDIDLPGVKDITENPKNIEFIEADAAQLPSMLPDATAAFINGNYAISANLDATKNGIYTPKVDGTYANVLACKTEDKDNPKIEVLKKVLTSDESRTFLNEHFKGIIIPVF